MPPRPRRSSREVDLGVTYFDTADSYYAGRSEDYLGRALASIGKRADVVVATKFGNRTGPQPTTPAPCR